jgi:hypothetical protein
MYLPDLSKGVGNIFECTSGSGKKNEKPSNQLLL